MKISDGSQLTKHLDGAGAGTLPSPFAPCGLDIHEGKINDGCHYYYKTFVVFDGGDNETKHFMFTTPNTDVRVHAKVAMWANVEFDASIYRGATVSDNGTPITTFNNDHDCTRPPGLLTYVEPTVTTPGTDVWATKMGSGKSPSTIAPGFNYKIIASRNSNYLFRITKRISGDGYVDIDFWWYEACI